MVGFPKKEQHMASACRKYCLDAIQLSETLIRLADEGNAGCDHDACLVFFGIILDTGSRIRREAEKRLNEIDTGEHPEKIDHS
jgi:hypothetical protein